MDKIGPICRGVEDCAIVLNAIYGPDGHDRSVGADPFHWEPRKPLKSLQGGRPADRTSTAVQRRPQKKIYDQALADLKKAGVNMTPVEYQEDLTGIRFLLEAEGAAAFDDITRDGQVRTLRGQAPGDWPNSFRSSRLIPAVEYIRAQRARTLLVEKFEKFMADWDVVVIPPQRAADHHQPHRQSASGDEVRLHRTTAMPRSDLGFLGKIYDEGSPLRVALAYEQATEWHKKNPTLSAEAAMNRRTFLASRGAPGIAPLARRSRTPSPTPSGISSR